MPKKILILTPFYLPNIGGAETFTYQLVQEAKKWEHVTILTLQGLRSRGKKYEEYYYKRGSLKIHRLRWLLKSQMGVWKGTPLVLSSVLVVQFLISTFFLTLKNHFHILHAQGLIGGMVAVILKKLFKVKVFITLLALYEFDKKPKWFQQISRWIFKSCDIIFVEGENGKRDIHTVCQSEKIRTFNHWVDQNLFKPPKQRLNDKIRVLFLGRPIPEKGRHIVEGAERLLNNPKYEFTYLEDVSYKDLPDHYQRSHIVVVPSLYPEGYSRVVAEAASCGCAVITSDRGSLPEMVEDFGIVVEPTSNRIRYVLSGFDYNHLSHCAYLIAKRDFSSKNANVFLNEYSCGDYINDNTNV